MADVRVVQITDPADVPTCAQLCYEAVEDDPFVRFMNLYNKEMDFIDETKKRLNNAVDPANTDEIAFKAVLDVPDEDGTSHEEIVGVSHWYYGNVVIPKYDTFMKEVHEEPNEIMPDEIAAGSGGSTPSVASVVSPEPAVVVKNAEEAIAHVYRQHGNAYISVVRGKRHVCKSGFSGFSRSNSNDCKIAAE
jgi:hypothetical protein